MLRSAVSSGRQVVHQSRRIFVGREVSSAAAAASQSSQSATCQLCERSSVVRYEQNRVQYEQNRVVYKIEAYTRCVPEQNRVVRGEHFLGAVIGAVFEGSNTEKTVWGAARTQGVVGSGPEHVLEAFCRRA